MYKNLAESFSSPGSFDSVKKDIDYIVKEHFIEFGKSNSSYSRQTIGRSFNGLISVQTKPYVKFVGKNEIPDSFPGLLVERRADVGIESHDWTTADTDYRCINIAAFAIQAGSLVAAQQSFERKLVKGKVKNFTLELVETLKQQIHT